MAEARRVGPGRPRLDGDRRGIKTSITLPVYVHAKLEAAGGLSTIAREVLEEWAGRQGDGPTERQKKIQTLIASCRRVLDGLRLFSDTKAYRDLAKAVADLDAFTGDGG